MEIENIEHVETNWEVAMENEFNRLFGFGFFVKRDLKIASSDFLEFARKWAKIAESNALGGSAAPNNTGK